MTGNELLRRLRRLGSERGIEVRLDELRGKGSHAVLYYGSRRTTLKDRRKELGTGVLREMLRQLGLSPRVSSIETEVQDVPNNFQLSSPTPL